MKGFELRHVIKATKDAGYKPEETREVLDGSLFSGAEFGFLGLLKNSLGNEENRKKLFDIMERKSDNPTPISEIIKISGEDKFIQLQKELSGKLTQKDLQAIDFSIKYFEDWFYRGNWTHIPENQKGELNSYAYFSVPAGIINMITKIKDSPEYTDKITQFNSEKLKKLFTEVDNFRERFLLEDRLKSLLSNKEITPEEKSVIETILQYRGSIISTLKRSEGSVKKALRNESKLGSKAADLYFVKTCLIAATKLMKEKVNGKNNLFLPDLAVGKIGESDYEIYDMSSGKDRTGMSKMHFPPIRLPYCKFVVKYFESLSNS